MTVTRGQRGTGGLAKFEAMLATGLSLETVCEIAVNEGVAESKDDAEALLASLSDERTDRRGRHRASSAIKTRIDPVVGGPTTTSSSDHQDQAAELPVQHDKEIFVQEEEEEEAIRPEKDEEEAIRPDKDQEEVAAPEKEEIAAPEEAGKDEAVLAVVPETTTTAVAADNEEEAVVVVAPPATTADEEEDATNFFAALLEETKEERGRFGRRSGRPRRSTSAPPTRTPVSPPLAEKMLQMQNEVPSRFKSDQRLKTEHRKRSTSARPLSLTVPESPALLTKRRSVQTAVRESMVVPKQDEDTAAFFKALALNPKIMQSSGDYGVPRIASAPTTSPRPFAFATDARRSIGGFRTARKPPPPSRDDLELAKAPATRRKVATVSRHLLATTTRGGVADEKPAEEVQVFKARPVSTASRPFRPAPSSKPLTKPEAPKMPGLEFHKSARAKLRQAQDLAKKMTSTDRKPLAPKVNELNSDRRARERRAYDLGVAERQQRKEADKQAALTAIQKAQHADLARKKRTSMADGGLQFVAPTSRYHPRTAHRKTILDDPSTRGRTDS